MSLVQENPLWGPGEAVRIRVPGLVLPAQDRRGEGGTRNRRRQVRGGGKSTAPPVAPPHRDTGQLPGTRAWALGKRGGREEEVPAEGQRKESSQGMPLQPASAHVSHGYCGGWVEWRAGLRGAGEPTDLMSIKPRPALQSLGLSVIWPLGSEKWPPSHVCSES